MSRAWLALALLWLAGTAGAKELRVCADPNNLPFSNQQRQGFENRIVERVAKELGASVRYVWWAQRRGNLRQTLNAGRCDVVPGIASGIGMIATTRPYYRSTYVFVSRRDRALHLGSLDDPRLRHLTLGVQLIGDDGFNTPPAHALARRGIVDNVRGYMLYGNYLRPSPPAAIVDAVAKGDVDAALVWGPLAGYFAAREPHPLELVPVSPWLDGPQWPMVFDISMGVRKDDVVLRRRLDGALEKLRPQVRRILKDYGVPLVADPTEPEAAASSPAPSITSRTASPDRQTP
jgi:mxaJ protein